MIYDAIKSRPVRFTIIFLKILYVLAISGIFTQSLNQVQAILLSIISAVVISLPAALIMFFLSRESKLLKGFGVLIALGAILVALYAILVVAAMLGAEESTTWSVNYMTSFIMKQFFFSPIALFLRLKVATYVITAI
jgi:hypothetical protein